MIGEVSTGRPFMGLSKGAQIYCGAILCGSLMQTSAKLLLEYVDEFVALQLRMGITSLICYSITGNKIFGEKEDRPLMLLRGFLTFFTVAGLYYSLETMALADYTAISFLQPLVTVILAAILLGEHLLMAQVGASLLALVGVALIAQPSLRSGSGSAVAVAIMVVFTSSFVAVILRKLKHVPPMISTGNSAIVCVVLSSIAVLFRPDDRDYPTNLRSWILLVFLGTFGFCRQYLNALAFATDEVRNIAHWKYTQLAWAVILELLFWHQLPGFAVIMGTLVVVGAVAWGTAASNQSTLPTPADLDESDYDDDVELGNFEHFDNSIQEGENPASSDPLAASSLDTPKV